MDKYKISIWEDIDDNSGVLKEQKIAEIGSNSMTVQSRAIDPILTENQNGTHTFTFKMYYRYIDTYTGEEVDNPFCNLMVNERKVKVLWKDKWYDFVIKETIKDSSSQTFTFNCQDWYINELSKNGFSLEFDTELENNMGTIDQLGSQVLEGTDWVLGTSDTLIQYQEETLWDVLVTSATAVPDRGGSSKTLTNKHVYMFNSSYQQGSGKVQFLYGEDPITTVDGSNVILDTYQDSDSDWDCYSATLGSFSGSLTIYRGRRVVNSIKQVYDEKLKKYVDVYKKNNNIYYVDKTTLIQTPQTVNNLILNSKDFVSLGGWNTVNTLDDFHAEIYPTYSSTMATNYDGKGYLKFSSTSSTVVSFYNGGLAANAIFLPSEGIQPGQQYRLVTKAWANTTQSSKDIPNTSLSAQVTFEGKCIDTTATSNSISTVFTSVGSGVWEVEEGANYTLEELTEQKLGIVFSVPNKTWVEEIQFYPYIPTENGCIEPGNFETESVVTEIYNIYAQDEREKETGEREYVYQGSDLPSSYIPETDTEKIRSITIKESNRFNIIQTLAETFNCWAVFEINHNPETGEIIPFVDGDDRGKRLVFKESLGEETGLGFVYGIDLRTVSRSLNSTNIVTKTIVKQNTNEFGEDGFCTIARAKENYPKENFILNFDYYITQGLLDGAKVNRDLYGTPDGLGFNGGYYVQLSNLNSTYDETINRIVQNKQILTNYEALLTVSIENKNAIEQQINEIKNRVILLLGVSDWNSALTSSNLNNPNPDGWVEVKNLIASEKLLEDKLNDANNTINNLESSIANLKDTIESDEATQDSIVEQKKTLNETFFAKYGAYLQEGTWNSEEYYDDSLYYLDACDVSNTSSMPQVSYNISVLRLQALEEFKSKVFNIGDTVFIEDPKFFGYTYIEVDNAVLKTPVHKKVMVSQIVSHFENPTQDTITIQNYKTDFEDLFQRITASTQSLQYASGEYNRAAGIMANNGGISGEILQTSLSNNNNLVYSVMNNAIIQDSTGILLTDISNPNNKLKITANGLYISEDGGANWKNAIRGSGIGTEYLSAGSIATNKINIYDGNWPSFRWDANGISAYKKDTNGTYYDHFVRFDQYGLYGVKGVDGDEFIPRNEDDIWNNGSFGVTWKGFFLKSDNTGGGYVSITSDNDIELFRGDSTTPAIKIGRLSGTGSTAIYGIKITDSSGASVMETASDGNLWLKNTLEVGDGINSTTKIGYDPTLYTGETAHRVIAVGDPSDTEGYYFVLYDDGTVETNSIVVDSAYVKGTVIGYNGYFGLNGAVHIDNNGLGVYDNENKPLALMNENGFSAYGTGLTIYKNAVPFDPPRFEVTTDTEIVPNKIYYTNNITDYEAVTNPVAANLPEYYEYDSTKQEYKPTPDTSIVAGKTYYTAIYTRQAVADPVKSDLGSYYEQKFNSGEPIFYYDNDTSLLYVKGNGEFTGTINADSGRIGDFIMERVQTNPGEDPPIYEEILRSSNNSLRLNGTDGSVEVRNISIGNEAKIDDYIKLSDNGYIFNPDEYHNVAFALGNVSIDSNNEVNANIILDTEGHLKLGSLLFDGVNSVLQDTADTWKIEEGQAYFNNVAISGVLNTAVFRASSVQTVAGVMIFRPGSKFTRIDGTHIKDVDFELKVNDYLVFSNTNTNTDFNEHIKVTDVANGTYTLSTSISEKVNYLIKLGNADTSGTNPQFSEDLIIGVNSTSAPAGMLAAKGFTFTQPSNVTNGKFVYPKTPLMFLGDLTSISESNEISGYGLYAENAYLYGSLTTRYTQNETYKYAGINTLSKVNFNIVSSVNDSSPIIFWAGSSGITSEEISKSAFQVTSDGTVYAQKAYITGTITGSDIYTASVHGNGDAPALKIIDENETGIVFYKGLSGSNNQVETFSITASQFKKDNYAFIKIYEETLDDNVVNKIDFNGNRFITERNLVLEKDQLYLAEVEDGNNLIKRNVLEFTQTDLNWYIFDGENLVPVMDLSPSGMKLNGLLDIESNLRLSAQEHRMDYQYSAEDSGYNLYIK